MKIKISRESLLKALQKVGNIVNKIGRAHV